MKSLNTKKNEWRLKTSLLLSEKTLAKGGKNRIKVTLGGGIGDDAVFYKSKLEGTDNDKFLETEKTITLSVQQPKKNASATQRKTEIAHEKNERDAVSFERCEINKLWERYCKQKKQITFRLFESKMKQSKFKADVLALR